jgi:hypothetical protein
MSAKREADPVFVDKPHSDPKRDLWFWRHRTMDGFVQLANVRTNLTPNWCGVHGFAFDCRDCPACEQLSLFADAP